MSKTRFATAAGALTYDDAELYDKLNEFREKIVNLRSTLDRKICHDDKYDYLSLTIARLAYEFAREEYDALCREAAARGLV